MRFSKGYHTFESININGEDYVKLKDVNQIISICYKSKIQGVLMHFAQVFDKEINLLIDKEFDVEKELTPHD